MTALPAIARATARLADTAARLHHGIGHTLTRAARDIDEHLHSPRPGTANTGYADDGTKPGPTPTHAFTADPVATDIYRLARHVKDAQHHIDAAQAAAHRLDGLPPDAARAIVDAAPLTIGGVCVNPHCGRWIAGGARDPIRSGRCAACAEYRRRTGTERPHTLTGTDPAHPPDCTACHATLHTPPTGPNT